MNQLPPRSTRTGTPFPSPTRFRSARALDREHEAGRGLGAPAGEAVGLQESIEGAVDLYRREAPGGKAKLALSGQLFRVEHATPAAVGPAGNADANIA